MNSIESISQLQDRIADAHRARARAEGARDAALADLNQIKQEMADEYGVHNNQQAITVLADMREQVNQLAADITATLDEIGIA